MDFLKIFLKRVSRTILLTDRSPKNVSINSIDGSPSLSTSIDINEVGNGTPNLFDPLLERTKNLVSEGPEIDDTLVYREAGSLDKSVLLMGLDKYGSPEVLGQVSYQYIFL